MTLQKLRDHLHARPFHPLVVRTVSGTRHTVDHPDFLFIPPVGDDIVIVDSTGRFHFLGVEHIKAVEVRRRNGRPK